MWPTVLNEFETMARVVAGKSLARFGDGELKLMRGASQVREPANPELAAELRAICYQPDKRCIVGIPTMDQAGPKYTSWVRHMQSFVTFLNPKVEYGSAFVSRPDSSPWIISAEYLTMVQSLWDGKRVHLVCEPGNSLRSLMAMSAEEVIHVPCPSTEAYAALPQIEEQLEGAELVIMSAGPAATCLAHRLASRGVHAVDFGSAGGFLLKLAAVPQAPSIRIVIERPKDMPIDEVEKRLRKHFKVLYFDGKNPS